MHSHNEKQETTSATTLVIPVPRITYYYVAPILLYPIHTATNYTMTPSVSVTTSTLYWLIPHYFTLPSPWTKPFIKPSNNNHPLDLSQNNVITNANEKYFNIINEGKQEEAKLPPFLVEGMCHGLAVVWLYYMRKNAEKTYTLILKFIVTLSSHEIFIQKRIIEQFLAMIELAQNQDIYFFTSDQYKLEIVFALLEYMNKFNKNYEFLFYLKQLKETGQDVVKVLSLRIRHTTTINDVENNSSHHRLLSYSLMGTISGKRHSIGFFHRKYDFFVMDANVSGKSIQHSNSISALSGIIHSLYPPPRVKATMTICHMNSKRDKPLQLKS